MTTEKSSNTQFNAAQKANDLAESAFEFLERAIGEFKTSPKFSTIHFSTSVELFLKARLMQEHWSLVVENSDKASRKSFSEGSAKTISTKTAIDRLSNIAGVNVPDAAAEVFNRLAEHRNRMIHFVHDSTVGEPDQKLVQQVATEQCRGWFHLARLLTDWGHLFSSWNNLRVQQVEASMRGHRAFLQAAYDGLKPEIARLKDAGSEFADCASCGHPAAEKSTKSENLNSIECLVCKQSDWIIRVECPDEDCGQDVEIRSLQSEQPGCKACGQPLLEPELREQLDTSPYDELGAIPINCALCVGHHSVIEHAAYFICTECRGVEDSAPTCGWCDERQSGGGNLEDSYLRGCEFCEGKIGWDDD